MPDYRTTTVADAAAYERDRHWQPVDHPSLAELVADEVWIDDEDES